MWNSSLKAPWAAAVAAAVAALAAHADITTVYLKDNSGYSAGKGFNGATWTDAGGSTVTIDDWSQYDFVVQNGRYIDPVDGETITAHKLTFGEIGGTKGTLRCRLQPTYNCTEGVVFANGRVYTTTTNHRTIQGKVSVTAPSSAPFLMDTTGSAAGGLTFSGEFTGATGTGFLINSAVSGCYFEFADASRYYGDIAVTATNGTGAASGDVRVNMTTLSAGTVRVGEGCTLAFTSSAQAGVTNLVMEDGSVLKFALPAAPNATPFLAVGTNLSCNGSVVLSFDTSALSLPVSESVTYAVMTIPAASVETSEFSLDTSYGIWDARRPVLSKSVDPVTGDVALGVSFYPSVVSSSGTGDDSALSEDAPSSMTNATVWSDGEVVHSKAHYNFNLKNRWLRTPWCPEGTYAFPGQSLTMGEYNTKLLLACRDFVCPILYAANEDAIKIYCAEASDVSFHGDIHVAKELTILIYNDHCFTMDGEFKSSGDVMLHSGTGSSTFSGHHRGDFALTRANEDFTGRVVISSASSATKRKWSDAEPYAHVYYSDPKCFGGPLAAFAYNALTLTRMARLITTNEAIFSDTTRGLYLANISQLDTPEADDSLTLLQPVTVNGSVYKQGAGTLAMGGELKFLDSESALTDTPPDDAANRTLCIQGGTLKPLAADALNGLDIVFSNSVNVAGVNVADVALEIDLDTEDADLRAYGLRNTKSPSPLALSLAGGATRVPVRLTTSATGFVDPRTVAVMTVRSEVADETFAKLSIRKPSGMEHVALKCEVVVDAEAGTSTLTATVTNSGLMMIVK